MIWAERRARARKTLHGNLVDVGRDQSDVAVWKVSTVLVYSKTDLCSGSYLDLGLERDILCRLAVVSRL